MLSKYIDDDSLNFIFYHLKHDKIANPLASHPFKHSLRFNKFTGSLATYNEWAHVPPKFCGIES